MAEYDLIIVGGGHNGLTCGAYLSKAGLKILVLEYRDIIGGFTMTEELRPGYRCNTHSTTHSWINAGPVYKDLELWKYGYEILYHDPQHAAVFRDGTSIIQYRDVDRTCEQIKKISLRDAKTYKEFFHEFRELYDVVIGSWYNPPVPYHQVFAPLEGTKAGARVIKMLLSSCRDIANELFDDDRVKIMILHYACQGANHPDTQGTGLMFATLFVGTHISPWGLAKGGSINCAIGLKNFIEAHGGKVVVNKPVKRILIENKVAVGVETEDGERITANKGIVSACGTVNMVLNLIGEEYLPEETIAEAKRYRWDANTAYYVYVATKEPYHYKAAENNPDIDNTYMVCVGVDTVDEMQRIYNRIKENRLCDSPWGVTQHFTKLDPSYAPSGKHLTSHWGLVCYDLDGDVKNWDLRREEIIEWEIKGRSEFVKNLTKDNIIDAWTYNPYDWKAPQQEKGSMMLGDTTLDQLYAYKPWFGASQYRLEEIERLYLSDATCHPTGGVSAAPGYNAANVIAEQLKIKKWWKK